MLTRFVTGFGAALAVTLGLLLLMQGMVATETRLITDPPVFRDVVFVMPPPAPPPPPRPRIEALRPPEAAPGGPEIPPGGRTPVEFVTPAPTAPDPSPFDPAFRMADGAALAIVTVAPEYPPPLALRGIEGYVIVEFDVTSTGRVEGVTVVESSHRGFERAAVDAAYRFKYRPTVIGGEPVATRGLRTRITFRLEG